MKKWKKGERSVRKYYLGEEYKNCINEEAFKQLYICKNAEERVTFFCIETEATIVGFPDVIKIRTPDLYGERIKPGMFSLNNCDFLEFKISNKKGIIKFKPTQPAFYKKNEKINTHVVAFNRVSNMVHIFPTETTFIKESCYYSNLQNEINLCKVEEAF